MCRRVQKDAFHNVPNQKKDRWARSHSKPSSRNLFKFPPPPIK
ncbi:unnamed protein product, partial [Adineta ricciae]